MGAGTRYGVLHPGYSGRTGAGDIRGWRYRLDAAPAGRTGKHAEFALHTRAQAFFGTPLLLLATAFVALTSKKRRAALFFGSGGLLYVLGAMTPTMAFNVPLNETLAMVETPLAAARAHGVWRDYSVPWQLWNALRAVAAGIVLLLVGLGVLSLGRDAKSC